MEEPPKVSLESVEVREMGHRCLVAYENASRRFDVRYSHWGAHALELRNDITEQTPLGGDASKYEPEFMTELLDGLESIADAVDATVEGYVSEIQNDRTVNPDPIARDCAMPEVVEMVNEDGGIEALYVVSEDFEVRAFRVLRVRLDSRGTLLIEPRWFANEPVSDERDRGRFNGVQTELKQLVDDGLLTEPEAGDRLIERMLEDIDGSSSRQVLAHSPALMDANHEEYPLAHVQTGSASSIHDRPGDDMIPYSYRNTEHWMFPEGFDSVLPEPLDDSECVPIGAKDSHQLNFAPFTPENPSNNVSQKFDIGNRVYDRTRNRSGPGSSNTLVVVWTPNILAQDCEIENTDKTVAEANPDFSRRDPVVEVVYVSNLPDDIDADNETQISEAYQRGDLEIEDVSKYAFPESRLGEVADDGSTVNETSVHS